MAIEYIATEYVGDPPIPIARWYKVQAGTYARITANGVEFRNPAQLNVEMSSGTFVEFVPGDDGKRAELEAVRDAWAGRR